MTSERFSHRTFHHRDFEPERLAARKRESGASVCVVIPARDEERTVGRVAGVLRRSLMDRVGLVDEIVVVDGDSSDATAEVARAAGVTVVRQSEVLPDAGSAPGKGEALWKGLAASNGDLVVFVDADVADIDPRFVVGLLGPLLEHDDIAFVKAAYDRPFRLGTEVAPQGGGRVTELMARPLLSTFWPELAWIAQPLSGEYAGRRSLLESLPFVRGYGVEIALLIDIAAGFGVDVIAQVDLEHRAHEHQPLEALGRMATEILHVAVERLAEQGRMALTDDLGRQLVQPFRAAGDDLQLRSSAVDAAQRPPLARWREANRSG